VKHSYSSHIIYVKYVEIRKALRYVTSNCWTEMFGKNLKRIRLKREMTQLELAEQAKIYKRHYQDVEACRKIPSVAMAARLRKALKCEWTDLMRGVK